jgi:competence protein ComEA
MKSCMFESLVQRIFRYVSMAAFGVVLINSASAQLPEGPGKAAVERICQQCHEVQRSISLRQDRDGWSGTVSKMISLGAQGTNSDFNAVIDYLATHYPGEPLPKIDANTARAIDFESAFSLRRSQSALLIAYRAKNGPFKSLEDLKKIPGVDFAKIEKHKDRLVFD